MGKEPKLHASVKPAPVAGLSAYEKLAALCGVLGLSALVFAGWLIWLPLAPAILGISLLSVAWMSARCARAESAVATLLASARGVPRRAA